ncbi:MAG: tetratricopeptide repeat protein [Gemmatimonadales bacterium]
MPADPERLRQIRVLFDAVADLPPGERPAALAAVDADLRAEVEALVAAAERTADFLGRPAFPRAAAENLVGTRLGPYEMVRLVGRGGMGVVYEAFRADDQYRKRVAVKLVQRGLDSELTFARFRRERQILANLEHPGIATLLDGGVTPDGRPFLVMEYVTGEPITAWCDARRLGVRERLELFRRIGDAVRYAHLNLVIHRDLKPANILVTEDGAVRLLDFGIAKLVDEGVEPDGPITRGANRPYTPQYASPEQIRGAPLTTGSDVYSLGVILFELLTGRRPHKADGIGLHDLERRVLDAPPPRPSTAVTPDAAVARGEALVRLRRRLEGDLDQIVLAALAPDPLARYRSVDALGDDIQRFLDGRPVEVRGPGLGYRARKFVGRNRLAVATTAMIAVGLVGGLVATSALARRAQQAQDRAERVAGFLREILSSVRPATGGRDVPVSEALDSASARLASGLADRPDVRGEVEGVIGGSYDALGRYPEAERHLREAAALLGRTRGEAAVPTLHALNALGNNLLSQGRLDAADTVLHRVVEIAGPGSAADTVRLVALDNLGSLAHRRGASAEAERYHREVLEIRRRMLGPNDDLLAVSINNVAVALGEQNRWPESEAMHREALAILERNYPDGGTLVADAQNALATALDLQGKTAAADSAYQRVVAMRRRLLGEEHPDYAFTLFNYAGFVFDQGRFDQAARLSRAVLALRGRTLGESHPAVAAALQTLGRCLDRLGDQAGAEAALLESLDLRRRFVPEGSWLVASSESVLGEHYATAGQYQRAERLLKKADEGLSATQGADAPRTLVNVRRLVALYDAWDRPDLAARYRERLGEKR